MGKTRLEFQAFLESFKGDRNVYYQPPPSFMMSFPAIVYNLAKLDNVAADNLHYLKRTKYKMIYITDNPDDPMIYALSDLPYCELETPYVSDNLNHYPYTIFY